MKSPIFSRPLVSTLLLLSGTITSLACGPYSPLIPTPDFFENTDIYNPLPDYHRLENLKLWQALTSPHIPLDHIEEVVYHHTLDQFSLYTWREYSHPDNKLYAFLRNTDDTEIINFLLTAKDLEERRSHITSPWYYPHDRSSSPAYTSDFDDIISTCRQYQGTRLRDRYALQTTRALFASRRYSDCITFADSAFADFPQSNLFKRMAQNYVAGCWSQLGDIRRADSLFAMAGNISSLSVSDPVRYMAHHNPAAPQIISYIRRNATDTTFMLNLEPIAQSVLKDRRVHHKADWHFLLAYINHQYKHNSTLARAHIRQAMKQSFSSPEMHDLARAYKMKLDATAADTSTLLADLRWIERKTDILNTDAYQWLRRCRNIIYADWIPRLWKSGDYTTAVLMCSYADNLDTSTQKYEICDFVNGKWQSVSFTAAQMRRSHRYPNYIDYRSLSFQMMGSLTSSQLKSVYTAMMSSTPLYNFLRRKVRTDRDYYYELIGTLAIREENYTLADQYLSQVSDHYLRTLNIYKHGHLSNDPRAKLHFAREMHTYQQTMQQGATDNQRGLARLKYAIGRYSAYENRWALTQYWRGWVDLFDPSLDYYDCDFASENYSFLYDYETTNNYHKLKHQYQSEIRASLAMLTDDNARAQAQYILGNIKTIIKHYGNTTTARFIKNHCDNWRNWL